MRQPSTVSRPSLSPLESPRVARPAVRLAAAERLGRIDVSRAGTTDRRRRRRRRRPRPHEPSAAISATSPRRRQPNRLRVDRVQHSSANEPRAGEGSGSRFASSRPSSSERQPASDMARSLHRSEHGRRAEAQNVHGKVDLTLAALRGMDDDFADELERPSSVVKQKEGRAGSKRLAQEEVAMSVVGTQRTAEQADSQEWSRMKTWPRRKQSSALPRPTFASRPSSSKKPSCNVGKLERWRGRRIGEECLELRASYRYDSRSRSEEPMAVPGAGGASHARSGTASRLSTRRRLTVNLGRRAHGRARFGTG